MEKVLITGMGIISPIGVTLDQNWQSIINGVSGVKQIDTFDATSYRTRFAGLIDDILVDESHQGKIKKRLRKKMSRSVYLNCLVSNMAIEDSGIDFSKINLERCGVAIGATGTELNPNEFVPLTDHDDSRIIKLMSNAYPAWISLNYGLEGPSMTVGTACASANYAIAWAYQQIALGLCDVMIAGGASNPVNPELLTGFSQMMALSERNDSPEEASRPFDKARDGFVMGEGSGLLILESETSARKRGARVYAELKLPSLTSEAYNIVAPAKDGAGMSKCMSKALFNANLNPQDIQYINAHGTSTKLNDDYETKAIKSVFKDHAYNLYVSSTKSMTGHCLAGAGGVESVITCKSLYENVLPPTINLDNPDDGLDLDYVANEARDMKITGALSNSFAFGGHNAVLPFVSY